MKIKTFYALFLTLGTEPLLDTRFEAIVCLLTVTLFICSTGKHVK